MVLSCCLLFVYCVTVIFGFDIAEYTHYLDYLRDERTASSYLTDMRPPAHIRNRKMYIGQSKLKVDDVLTPFMQWPQQWPYSFEAFQAIDRKQH